MADKMPKSIESSNFASYRARISGEFDSRKDLHLVKFEQRPGIFVKLCFRGFSDSKLSGLHPFDNTAVIHQVRNRSKSRLEFHKAPILEVVFVTL